MGGNQGQEPGRQVKEVAHAQTWLEERPQWDDNRLHPLERRNSQPHLQTQAKSNELRRWRPPTPNACQVLLGSPKNGGSQRRNRVRMSLKNSCTTLSAMDSFQLVRCSGQPLVSLLMRSGLAWAKAPLNIKRKK